jgi:hypothetical protein
MGVCCLLSLKEYNQSKKVLKVPAFRDKLCETLAEDKELAHGLQEHQLFSQSCSQLLLISYPTPTHLQRLVCIAQKQ